MVKRIKKIRAKALLKIIKEEKADIIALQEVKPWFLKEIKEDPILSRYHTTANRTDTDNPSGLVILSKFPIKSQAYHPFPSRMKRGILFVNVLVKGLKLKIATIHLDSFLEDGEIRSKQLDEIWAYIGDNENVILMGDFNFGDRELPESNHIHEAFKDCWMVLKKGQPGFTWNIDKNAMAKQNSFPKEESRRLDRIYFKSKHIKPLTIKLIGQNPLKGSESIFPSDHFGLSAGFTMD